MAATASSTIPPTMHPATIATGEDGDEVVPIVVVFDEGSVVVPTAGTPD